MTLNQRRKPSLERVFELLGEFTFEAGEVEVVVDVERQRRRGGDRCHSVSHRI